MKKHVFLFAFTLMSIVSYAQELYIKDGLGYFFPQAGQSLAPGGQPYNGTVIASSYTYGGNNSTSYNYKNNVSFLTGVGTTAGVGYMFTKHLGVEVDYTTIEGPQKYIASERETGYSDNTTEYAKMPIFISPQLVMQTNINKIVFYTRVGVVLPLHTHFSVSEEQIQSNGGAVPDDYIYAINVKLKFSVGLTAAAGVRFKLGDHMGLWAELNTVSMALATKEATYTETQNGINVTPAQNTISYSNNFTVSSTSSINNTVSESFKLPFSNIGVQAGISYSFVKRAKKAAQNTHQLKIGRSK